jgi:hypothetical protein
MIANAPEPTYRGGLGLRDPKVTITLTETLDRQATGKLRRFVSLGRYPPDRASD